ncbi:MAG: hypothetical protein KC649_00990 [Candidatus Omnitrophica bacterium]|nr:hypothetical protein [Candidatus Omnitrophota bacterium]
MENPNNLGLQPLDALMNRLHIDNADVVAASKEQITFKMVQKGRKGRRLTLHVRMKILRALQSIAAGHELKHEQLFNYS